jgi:hypothetical protein
MPDIIVTPFRRLCRIQRKVPNGPYTCRLKQLQCMKLLPNSYVFMSEDKAKLYVAEK